MGNTCGGVASNCCSNEQNVDINGHQVDNSSKSRTLKNGYQSGTGIRRNHKVLSMSKIMEMPPDSQERQSIESMVTKVNALIRGHVARCKYKKFYFLNLVTGKKAHEFTLQEIDDVPTSRVLMVKLKEQEFKSLKVDDDMKRIIKENRNKLEFKNGMILPEGQQYSGTIDPTTREKTGYGIQIWPDGSKYEGFWQDDKAKGYGRFILADGDVYQGEWNEDKAHGMGDYYYAEGATYKGSWIEDKQEGHGREEWPDGSYYQGSYLRGKKHGKGLFQWADGAKYEGEWRDNKMHGKGDFKWSDGRVYLGDYYNDKKHGQGKYIWPDGRQYTGRFSNGKQHGKGIYKQTNGQEVYGVWDKGKKNIICKDRQEYLLLDDTF